MNPREDETEEFGCQLMELERTDLVIGDWVGIVCGKQRKNTNESNIFFLYQRPAIFFKWRQFFFKDRAPIFLKGYKINYTE